MDSAADHHRRRLLIAVIAAVLALLVAVVVGVYGLLRGPTTTGAGAPSSPSASAPVSPTRGRRAVGPVPILGVSDPAGFARAVANALFTWDTATGFGPSEYTQVLADAADPAEADALAADVAAYLPTTQAWAQLRQYATRQWLTIDSIGIPGAWATAIMQAAPGQLPAGAVAYTVTGTRHRAGIWGTQPVQTTGPVAFTVFMVCRPVAPEFRATLCRLLRLSQLDHPLH